jgi:hypothetical protein
MTYSRTNPSPRYLALTELYRRMHREGVKEDALPAAKTFPGKSLLPQAIRIKKLIERTRAQTILDYGSGKGLQYEWKNLQIEGYGYAENMIEYWDVTGVQCYDPCYEPLSRLPQGRFDGVISTDVLEHCAEDDIPWIVEEIFGFASRFVFANVAAYAATKNLPNGENAHCTQRPAGWWEALFRRTAARHPHIDWEVWVRSSGGKGLARDDRVANFDSVE